MEPIVSFVPVLAAADPGNWALLEDVLLLLLAAVVFGALAERFKQSVVVGYLLAGCLVGPNVLGGVQTQHEMMPIAELGVALLLFSIGLEFSPSRLLMLGRTVLWVGVLQITFTALGAGLVAWTLGLSSREVMLVGMMVSVSSTATVLRVLTDRAELDSLYGRSAVGVLLLQDIAVIPMIILASAMRGSAGWWEVLRDLSLAILLSALILGVFYTLFNLLVPRLMLLPAVRRNRDLPILLAVVMSAGSAWLAHRVGLSPSLGAFTAGVLLALSPYAVQIRADTRPLATVMVALFFSAIGMYGDPVWIVRHAPLVLGVLAAILCGKAILIAALARWHRRSWNYAITLGCTLAQVGEFSFVLAMIGIDPSAGPPLISETTFRAMVSATIGSMMLTPYLIAAAPRIAQGWEHVVSRARSTAARVAPTSNEGRARDQGDDQVERPLVVIIGFGPSGQRVAEGLLAAEVRSIMVVDLNPENLEVAQRYGLQTQLGDATGRDVLEHAGIAAAQVVVLTLPDHRANRQLISLVRWMAPDAYILVRCRYHVTRWDLLSVGAHEVVDEEMVVGECLAAMTRQRLVATGMLNEPTPDLLPAGEDLPVVMSLEHSDDRPQRSAERSQTDQGT